MSLTNHSQSSQPARGRGEITAIPVVGLGSSAGGLEALKRMLPGLSPGCGFAFVIAQHLSPTHTSMMDSLLNKSCKLPVLRVVDGQRIEADHIYVTPPNKDVAVDKGVLRLFEPESERIGPKPSIDRLFISLAREFGERAVCIVLSGTGSDGSFGARTVKAAGGLVIAQSEVSAKYSGMPCSALKTGCVDAVLPPEDIPAFLSSYRGRRQDENEPDLEKDEDALSMIFRLLEVHTHIDFSFYKTGTVSRRLQARMNTLGVRTLGAYCERLQESATEVEQLAGDLLIGVTSFFRDNGVFEALIEPLRLLLSEKAEDEGFRVWVPGCSTGQEVYSLAMVIATALQQEEKTIPVQIFATDVRKSNLAVARSGEYSDILVQEIPPKYRQTYIQPLGTTYQVTKELRGMVVFSLHDVTKDPPFLNLDLICCRNMLIYLKPEIQEHVFKVFRSALKPGGLLLLGKSETPEKNGPGFVAVDRKNHLYKNVGSPVEVGSQRTLQHGIGGIGIAARKRLSKKSPTVTFETAMLQTLVSHLAPDSVVIDQDFLIHRIYGDINAFIRISAGNFEANLAVLVREALQIELQWVIRKASVDRVVAEGNLVNLDEGPPVRLTAYPFQGVGSGKDFFLVAFRRIEMEPSEMVDRLGDQHEVARLESELKSNREHLRLVMRELEVGNEDLEVLNEAMIVSNEELQAGNEELETANEELQATNEELITVNDELQLKSAALAAALSDVENIQNSIDMGILVVDQTLKITRVNNWLRRVFNLHQGGEAMSLVLWLPRLGDQDPARIVGEVMESGVGVARETRLGEQVIWWRVMPYLDAQGRSAGAIIVFQDITNLKEAELAAVRSQHFLQAGLDALDAHIAVLDDQGLIIQVNRAWCTFADENQFEMPEYGIGQSYFGRGGITCDSVEKTPPLRGIREVVRGEKSSFQMEYPCHSPSERRWFMVRANRFQQLNREWVVVMHSNISQRREAEDKLRKTNRELKREVTHKAEVQRQLEAARVNADEANRAKSEFLANVSHEIRTPLNAILGFSQMLKKKGSSRGLSGELLDYIENINVSARGLAVLIGDVLDLAKIESGRDALYLEAVNPRVALDHVAKVVSAEIERKNLGFKVHFADDVPNVIRIDGYKLHRIMMNLIGNAAKFTPRGKGITVSMSVEDKLLIFRVDDEGIGVPESERKRIFEAFEQVHGGFTRAYRGTGLGLAICGRFAAVMGGEVLLRDKSGPGSCFEARLPFQVAVPDELSPAHTADVEAIDLTGRQVLVAEDNPINLHMMKVLLEEKGAEVIEAENGKVALEKIHELEPDLVFLDLRMPIMNGIEVVRALRSDPRFTDLPVFILSADAVTERRREAEDSGANAYLTKPVNFPKLAQALQCISRSEPSMALKAKAPEPETCVVHGPDGNICRLLSELTSVPVYRSGEILGILEQIKAMAGDRYHLDEDMVRLRRAVFTSNESDFKEGIDVLKMKTKCGGDH